MEGGGGAMVTHTQVCILDHATALTQSCNNGFDIFDVVKIATQACIF